MLVCLGLELEVEASWKSVELDLTLGELSDGLAGGLTGEGGGGGGEHSLGQQTSQITCLQHLVVDMVGVVWVDKWRLWLGVIIVLIFILLGFTNLTN